MTLCLLGSGARVKASAAVIRISLGSVFGGWSMYLLFFWALNDWFYSGRSGWAFFEGLVYIFVLYRYPFVI